MNNYDGDLLLLRKRISQIERLCGAISEAIGINLDELVRRADQAPASSPALTRDDILRWPESEDGLRRLREECAKIAGLKKGLISQEWFDPTDLNGITGPKHYIPWRPDCDANQCKKVIDALAKDGWDWDARINVSASGRSYSCFKKPGAWCEVLGVELPDADWLLKTCLAACIAVAIYVFASGGGAAAFLEAAEDKVERKE